MYIATIDYYNHETTVDPRLLFKLIRIVKGGIALGVYHVKNVDGEWRTLPKHQDLKALVAEYGANDYQEVY